MDGRRLELPTSALRTNGGSARISLSVHDVKDASPRNSSDAETRVFAPVSACSCTPVVHNLTTKEVGALDGHPGRWDSDLMTQAAKKLLEEFDALQEGDRAEVLAELLRRVALAPHDLPDPDDLVSAADQIFLELDRREQSQ